MCTLWMQSPRMLEEYTRVLGTGVIAGCELPLWVPETELWFCNSSKNSYPQSHLQLTLTPHTSAHVPLDLRSSRQLVSSQTHPLVLSRFISGMERSLACEAARLRTSWLLLSLVLLWSILAYFPASPVLQRLQHPGLSLSSVYLCSLNSPHCF